MNQNEKDLNLLARLKPCVERVPIIAVIYRAVRAALAFRRQRPQNTPFGFKLMGNPLMQRGAFETEETRLIQRLLQHSEVFVDVGANIGFYTCLARVSGQYVVAVEPLRENLDYLMVNLDANGWHDVELYPVALARQPGLAILHGGGTAASLINGWDGASPLLRRTIPLSTLDILLNGRFPAKNLLIKVDVEGAEFDLLQGAPQILGRDPAPVWMVEITLTEHHPAGFNRRFKDTFEIFWQHGYQAWTADCNLRSVTPTDVATWAQKRHCTFGHGNYLFTRADPSLGDHHQGKADPYSHARC
jgi:FkbM family methyltransferase